MIKKLLPPRFATDTEHAVVYRRENEFASHPFSRGFWETAAGHLICNFSVADADYNGAPHGLAHHNLIRNPGGRRGVTIRSEDRGRTWHIWNEDRNRPEMDVRGPQPGIDGKPGGLAEIGPIDFTDRNVLVSNFYYQYTHEDPQIRDFVSSLTTAFGPADNQAFFRISKDAGQTWSRSAMLPPDGLYSLSAVESSLVRPDGRCLLFLTGGETREGQHNRFPAARRDVAERQNRLHVACRSGLVRGHVDRSLQERRWRADLAVPFASQRFRSARLACVAE